MGKKGQRQRATWASRAYNDAIYNPDLLPTKEAAAYLGVSEYWLRKYTIPTEWHHCYTSKYGGHPKAYFWHKDDLDALKGPELEAARKRKAAGA